MAKTILSKLSSPAPFSNVLMTTSATRIDAVICVSIYDHSFDIRRVIPRLAHGLWMTLHSIVRSNVDI